MKALILAIFALLTTSVVVVGLAFPPGSRFSDGHLARLRGTDAYYGEGESSLSIGPLQVPLRGAHPVYLLVGVTFTYRKSLQFQEAEDQQLAGRRPHLMDALNVYLSDRRAGEVETREGLFRLKRDLRGLIERTAFPEQEGRVERIYFDPILLQS